MHSDDDLAAALTALWATADPLPEAAYQAAVDAYAWRDVDRQLARLSAEHDGETQLAHVRGGATRSLTFETGRHVIDLQAGREGRRRRLLGQLDPPAPASVTVESTDGSLTAQADERGRFLLDDLAAPGWIRLGVAIGDDMFATEWFYV